MTDDAGPDPELRRAPVVDVALPLPIRQAYTYLIPEGIEPPARGARVSVPLGPRRLVGFVTQVRTEVASPSLRPITGVLDREPLVSPLALELAALMARRYFCGIGEVLAAFVPAGVKRGARGKRTAVVLAVIPDASEALKDGLASARERRQRDILLALLEEPTGLPKETLLRQLTVSESPLATLRKKGLVRIEYREEREDVFGRLEIRGSSAPPLTQDQTAATGAIAGAIAADVHRAFLLFGVTGSGKTEVYLDAIGRALERGRGAIVLVPEISLTPQTVERFASRFGSVAVLHSQLTDAERAHQWEELRNGEKRIAIGPRSAVFAPVAALGLIILDEEHETTFKQQNTPRYHARDVALMRGRLERAVVVLGSATPSLEIWEAAQSGAVTTLRLPSRITQGPLPAVTLLDMRVQKVTGPGGLFSPLLMNMVSRNLDRGEQTLLFLNRRGYHTSLICRKCGLAVQCKNCDIPLTYYKGTGLLLCHYCHHQRQPPSKCAECGGPAIRFKGFGTEAVEYATTKLFPRARIERMDGQSMKRRGSYEEVFARVKSGEIDILIGTQMVAKGLDFPGITLIGVIAGDTSLLIPDFRAAERTFQLMTQVAGRAGRGDRPGRVFIQTYTPEHYSYQAAASHDFEAFAEQELHFRREARYPPYGVLVRVVVQGREEKRVIARMEKIAAPLEERAMTYGARVLGPCPAPIPYLKQLHRHHLVLRAEKGEALEELLEDCERVLRGDKHVQVLVDRDPTSMM